MSPGATPEASVDNLVAWLDTVAISLGLHGTFVFDGNNTRIMGSYHHVSVQQETHFRTVLHSKFQVWGRKLSQMDSLVGTYWRFLGDLWSWDR